MYIETQGRMDDLAWLAEWYAAQCNGDWEHQSGVTIGSLDNPGWSLTINLEGTALEGRTFAPQEHDLMSNESWWTCAVKGTDFEGQCGPRDLPVLLSIFRKWADLHPS
jgi:hypothetical protein